MTAIKIRVGSAPPVKSNPPFLDVLCRGLIILCVCVCVVLSSVSVCDGLWLLAGRRVFGLWYLCSVEEAPQGSVSGPLSLSSNCSRHLEEAGVGFLAGGMAICRAVVSLAVVSAVFGLELLVMSQASEGRDSSRRWAFGARLVLLAGLLAGAGIVLFVVLLWGFTSLFGFTLTFWCQFTATMLFFVNAMAARHVQNIELRRTVRGLPEKL